MKGSLVLIASLGLFLVGFNGSVVRAQGTAAKTAAAPQVYEEFNGWTGVTSPDGLWRRNGDWVATGNNLFKLSNCLDSVTYKGQPGGYLDLIVRANKLEGGEIQTIGTTGSNLGYGYYEVKMMPGIPFCCVSFFWKQVNYGAGEIDIEFLTNELGGSTGKVHYTVQPDMDTYIQTLAFGPSKAFHRYGFLWTATKIVYTVDGHVVYTFSSPTTAIPATKGYIMMNAWTGTVGWGDGPPPIDVHSYYDWVKFWPNLAAVPDDSSSTGFNAGPVLPMQSPAIHGANPVRSLADLRIGVPQARITLYDLAGTAV